MWSKIWRGIKSLFSKALGLFKVAFANAKPYIADYLNDKEVQEAAFDAILAVNNKGLKNNEALDAAVDILKQKGYACGMSCANTVLRTLIQNAYCAIKCSDEEPN